MDSADSFAPEIVPGLRLMPVVHERVDLATIVRSALSAVEPAAVAVELPTTLREVVLRAVARLPRISVVISEEEDDDPLVWVVAPGDPLVEALRWAVEHDLPVFLIDPDVRYREHHRDPLPDPHTMWSLGVSRYLATIRELAAQSSSSDTDTLRERGMAFHARAAAEQVNGTTLCLVGAAHATAVPHHLAGPTAPPLARPRAPVAGSTPGPGWPPWPRRSGRPPPAGPGAAAPSPRAPPAWRGGRSLPEPGCAGAAPPPPCP